VHTLRLLTRLTRTPIALLATLSTATGYLVVQPHLGAGLAGVCGAVFLLAAGASALNQWQERALDARMARTRTRPLPARAVTPRTALAIACALILAGSALLFARGVQAGACGLLTIVIYNGLYTPLKRVSAFAAVPGALIGTLPPVIGWIVAGAPHDDPRLLALAFFFFIWQMPHFWLLLLTRGDEYAAAGLPTLTQTLGHRALARLTFAWLATAALSAPLLAWFGLTRCPWSALALVVAGGLLLRSAIALLRHDLACQPPFRATNLFACAVMLLLVADAAWTRTAGLTH
jgi:protoheme IX farnesyltransferase